MYIIDREYFIRSILNSSEEELGRVNKNIANYYIVYSIPKKAGNREIAAITKTSALGRIQENMAVNFLNKIALPIPVIGFVPGRGYIDFLRPHVGKRFFLRIDIKNFFGSISKEYIYKSFAEFFSENCKECVDHVASLCTYNGSLPQGAVTSPAVSNVVFRRIDQRILKYCQSFHYVYKDKKKQTENIIYTRYADDMLFSSEVIDFSKDLYFLGMIRRILKENEFQVNEDKIRFGRDEIVLSGYVLSTNIHLSRKKLYSINKLIHYFGKTENYASKKYRIKKSLFNGDWIAGINSLKLRDNSGTERKFVSTTDVLNYICGYRAFIISVIRANSSDDIHVQQLKRKVEKLELIIDEVALHAK